MNEIYSSHISLLVLRGLIQKTYAKNSDVFQDVNIRLIRQPFEAMQEKYEFQLETLVTEYRSLILDK